MRRDGVREGVFGTFRRTAGLESARGGARSPTRIHEGDTVSMAEVAVKKKMCDVGHAPSRDARSLCRGYHQADDIGGKTRRARANRLAQLHAVAELEREHADASDRRHDRQREGSRRLAS